MVRFGVCASAWKKEQFVCRIHGLPLALSDDKDVFTEQHV